MSTHAKIADLRSRTEQTARAGLRGVDPQIAYDAAHINGLWDALEVLAREVDKTSAATEAPRRYGKDVL
jgi:hypothetical protein